MPAMFSIALLGIAVAMVAEGGLSILGVGVHLPERLVGQPDRGRRTRSSRRSRISCSSRSSASSSPCCRSTTSATSCGPASTCGRARCESFRAAAPKAEERFPDAPLDGPLLDVTDVQTYFKTERGLVRAVDGVSLTLERGKTLGVVGESGSGKSVLSRSIMGLLPEQRRAPRQHQVRGPRDRVGRHRDDAPVLGHADVDGLPGPDDVAEPGDADRQADHRVAALPPRREQGLRRRDRARAAARRSGSPRPSAGCASTRTSCRAACASA